MRTPLTRNNNYRGTEEANGHTTAADRTSAATGPPPRSLTLARLVVTLKVLPVKPPEDLDLLRVHVLIRALIT